MIMGMAMTALFFFACCGRTRQLTAADLDPVKVWTAAENRVSRTWERGVKYYENMRLVFEIQTQLKEWNDEAPDAANAAAPNSSKQTANERQQMNETPQPPPLETAGTIVGYCRACGKALDQASVRRAHGTIYCKEHVPLDETAQSRGIALQLQRPSADRPTRTSRPAWPSCWV